MLKVLTYPNPILTKKSESIENPMSQEIQNLITEMIDTIRADKNAIALAAPQVGKNLNLFIVEIKNEPLVFINPRIQKLSGRDVRAEEGCLSFPGEYLPVTRPNKVKVKFLDINGEKQILKTSGLLSRAIQHEYDHLEGILFIERTEQTI